MRTLVIETASEACSVALFEGPDVAAWDHRVLGRGHAESLVPMISGLPQSGKAERILVSLGPGSFTGVRVGLATARALGIAWKAQVIGYPTLALVARAALEQGADQVRVCMNGGHGEWLIQDFGQDGLPLAEFASIRPERAAKEPWSKYISGNRANELGKLIEKNAVILPAAPEARFALHIPTQLLSTSLSPIYPRGPDATPQKTTSTP